ncbi:MAG: C40 family peptidase [Rubrobacter sp.]
MALFVGKARYAAIVALTLAVMIAFVGVKAGSAEAQSYASGDAVVAEAQSWLGVPYVYGGASRSGVDCSGLTQQVAAAFGVSLPHSAAGQYGYGVEGTGAAGDLVFSDFTGGGIGHVGVATGDGQMINAPYPGTTVRYDPISDGNLVGYRTLV